MEGREGGREEERWRESAGCGEPIAIFQVSNMPRKNSLLC